MQQVTAILSQTLLPMGCPWAQCPPAPAFMGRAEAGMSSTAMCGSPARHHSPVTKYFISAAAEQVCAGTGVLRCRAVPPCAGGSLGGSPRAQVGAGGAWEGEDCVCNYS